MWQSRIEIKDYASLKQEYCGCLLSTCSTFHWVSIILVHESMSLCQRDQVANPQTSRTNHGAEANSSLQKATPALPAPLNRFEQWRNSLTWV